MDRYGRSAYILACSPATPPDSDINQTARVVIGVCEKIDACMPVCLLRAGQPRHGSDVAKSGQFIGQFSWVTGDPISIKGLNECFHY